MKRVVSFLLTLLLLSGLSAWAADWSPMQVDYCREYVTLRADPDTRSEEICKVYVGEVVMATRQNSSFSRCRYNDKEGYILSRYLNASIRGYSEPYNFKIGNCNSHVNLRKFPNAQSKSLAKIPKNAEVKVIYHDDSYNPDLWVCVQYDGAYGFVRWKYLK